MPRSTSSLLWLAVVLLSAALGACQPHADDGLKNDPLFSGRPSSVSAVHHYGRGHHIGEFSIDGKSCGNAGHPRGNSGSDTMCHIQLPNDWRPGLKRHVKWNVTNWTDDLKGLQPGNAGQWFEADAEIERFSTNYGTEIHFFPGGVVRIVPNMYGPPTADTRPDQTPPLAELPVYEPGWYAMGGRMAALKHEGKYGDDLKEFQADKQRFYAFLQRLYTARGLSAEQIQALLDKERDEEARSIRSGQLSYFSSLLARQGMSRREAFEKSEAYRDASQAALDAAIEQSLPAKKP